MPRRRGKPLWHYTPLLGLVVVIAVVATLIGIYLLSRWEQPPAVIPEEPALDEPVIIPQR